MVLSVICNSALKKRQDFEISAVGVDGGPCQIFTFRATPALLVARGTGEEKGPVGRGMGLQRM